MTVQEKKDAIQELIDYGGLPENKVYKQSLFPNTVYTASVKYLCTICESYWLLTEILLRQTIDFIEENEFQVWELFVNEDESALLKCTDGNKNILYQKEIEYTKFPLEKIKFYVENGVLFLACER